MPVNAVEIQFPLLINQNNEQLLKFKYLEDSGNWELDGEKSYYVDKKQTLPNNSLPLEHYVIFKNNEGERKILIIYDCEQFIPDPVKRKCNTSMPHKVFFAKLTKKGKLESEDPLDKIKLAALNIRYRAHNNALEILKDLTSHLNINSLNPNEKNNLIAEFGTLIENFHGNQTPQAQGLYMMVCHYLAKNNQVLPKCHDIINRYLVLKNKITAPYSFESFEPKENQRLLTIQKILSNSFPSIPSPALSEYIKKTGQGSIDLNVRDRFSNDMRVIPDSKTKNTTQFDNCNADFKDDNPKEIRSAIHKMFTSFIKESSLQPQDIKEEVLEQLPYVLTDKETSKVIYQLYTLITDEKCSSTCFEQRRIKIKEYLDLFLNNSKNLNKELKFNADFLEWYLYNYDEIIKTSDPKFRPPSTKELLDMSGCKLFITNKEVNNVKEEECPAFIKNHKPAQLPKYYFSEIIDGKKVTTSIQSISHEDEMYLNYDNKINNYVRSRLCNTIKKATNRPLDPSILYLNDMEINPYSKTLCEITKKHDNLRGYFYNWDIKKINSTVPNESNYDFKEIPNLITTKVVENLVTNPLLSRSETKLEVKSTITPIVLTKLEIEQDKKDNELLGFVKENKHLTKDNKDFLELLDLKLNKNKLDSKGEVFTLSERKKFKDDFIKGKELNAKEKLVTINPSDIPALKNKLKEAANRKKIRAQELYLKIMGTLNKDLSNNNSKNYRHQLELQARLRKKLSIKHAINLFVNSNYESYRALNPDLTDQDIKELNKLTIEYLLLKTKLQQIVRTQKNLKNNNPSEEERTKAAEELSAVRQFDPENIDNRALLVYEYKNGIMLRKRQVDIVSQLLSRNSAKEYEDAVIEERCGAGKTSVIATIANLKHADGQHLAIYMLPALQIRTTAPRVMHYTELSYGQKGHLLEFHSLSDLNDVKYLADILDTLISTINNREYIIITPDTIHSMQQYRDYLGYQLALHGSSGSSSSSKTNGSDDHIIQNYNLIKNILFLLKERGVVVADEVDYLLHPRHETNTALSDKSAPDSKELALVSDLIKSIVQHSNFAGLVQLELGNAHNISKETLNNLTKDIVNNFCDKYKKGGLKNSKVIAKALAADSKNFCNEFTGYILGGQDSKYPLWLDELNQEQKNNDGEGLNHADIICALKFYITKIFPIVLGPGAEKVGEGYGIEGKEAIPFAKVMPVSGSEIANLQEKLFKSLVASLHVGINNHNAEAFLRYVKDRAKNEQGKKLELLGELSKLGVTDISKLNSSVIITVMNEATKSRNQEIIAARNNLILDFERTRVLPSIRFFNKQFKGNGHDILKAFKTVQGISGTIAHSTLPLSLRKKFANKNSSISGSKGIIVERVINNPDNKVEVVPKIDIITNLEKIYQADLKNNGTTFKNTRVFLDISGEYNNNDHRDIATKILEFYKAKGTNIEGVLFFDKRGNLFCLKGDKNNREVIPIASTSKFDIERATGLSMEKLFSFFHQGQTRASDFAFPSNTHALAAVDANTNLDDLIQGLMRMRQLIRYKGQSVTCLITPESSNKIDQLLGANKNSSALERLFANAQIKQAEQLLGDNFRVTMQGLQDVLKDYIYQKRHEALTVEEDAKLYKQFSSVILHSLYSRPYDIYRFIETSAPVANIFEEYINTATEQMKTLGVPTADITELKKKMMAVAHDNMENLRTEELHGRGDNQIQMQQKIETKADMATDTESKTQSQTLTKVKTNVSTQVETTGRNMSVPTEDLFIEKPWDIKEVKEITKLNLALMARTHTSTESSTESNKGPQIYQLDDFLDRFNLGTYKRTFKSNFYISENYIYTRKPQTSDNCKILLLENPPTNVDQCPAIVFKDITIKPNHSYPYPQEERMFDFYDSVGGEVTRLKGDVPRSNFLRPQYGSIFFFRKGDQKSITYKCSAFIDAFSLDPNHFSKPISDLFTEIQKEPYYYLLIRNNNGNDYSSSGSSTSSISTSSVSTSSINSNSNSNNNIYSILILSRKDGEFFMKKFAEGLSNNTPITNMWLINPDAKLVRGDENTYRALPWNSDTNLLTAKKEMLIFAGDINRLQRHYNEDASTLNAYKRWLYTNCKFSSERMELLEDMFNPNSNED